MLLNSSKENGSLLLLAGEPSHPHPELQQIKAEPVQLFGLMADAEGPSGPQITCIFLFFFLINLFSEVIMP